MTRRSLLLTEKPASLASDLAAIDYTLKLIGLEQDPQTYMPKLRKRSIFAKGEKRRLIMQTLKQADKPLTSREITLAILQSKDFDMSDKRRLKQTVTGVYLLLVAESERGRVCSVGGNPVKWAIN